MNGSTRARFVCLMLCLALVPGFTPAAMEPPITAHLDVLGTPTLGGCGQVIWAAIPNVTAEAAELAFIVRRPGGAPDKVTTAPLTLVQGQVAEVIYLLDTPQAGVYQVTVRVRFSVAGETWEQTTPPLLVIPIATQKSNKPQATGIPLTLNGPMVVGEITQPAEVKTFPLSTSSYFTMECFRGTIPNFKLALKTYARNVTYSAVNCPNNIKKTHLFAYGWGLQLGHDVIVSALDGVSTGTFLIHVTTGPILKTFKINNGDPLSSSNLVTLNNYHLSYVEYLSPFPPPSEYLASESPDFINAVWRVYSSAPAFTLSPGIGKKTVYFKVRRAGLESAVYSDDIELYSIPVLLPDGPAVPNYLPKGGTIWTQFTVTAPGRYVLEKKTLSGENAPMQLFGPNSTTRSKGFGTDLMTVDYMSPGIYYLNVHTNYNSSSYTLRLLFGGYVSSLKINNNAVYAASRLVTLNNQCLGAPVSYMASIYSDFRDAKWLPYSVNPSFKLNAGNVTKRVYFKIKRANGSESAVFSDEIILREILPLTADAQWRGGNINPAGDADWFQFTAAADGDYTVESRCGALEDTIVSLYGPASTTVLIAEDNDSGENYAGKITARLKRGTYYVKVASQFPTETGTFSIAVKRN